MDCYACIWQTKFFLHYKLPLIYIRFLSRDLGNYSGNQALKRALNNYWMRLSMISWIMKTEVCVICRGRRLRQITQTRGFDDSWYHAKTEFNNCFIIHFSHNSSWETETKHSALTLGRRHSTLNKRTPLNKPIVFIVFLVLLSFHVFYCCTSAVSSTRSKSQAFSHFVSEENTPRGLVTRQTLNLTW